MELMVVVLIIAVLMAIAVPTFMGFRRRAEDASAKAGANLGIKVAKSLTDEDSSAPVTLAALSVTEPSLTFVLAVYRRSQTCYFMRDDIMGSTTYGVLLDVPVADCQADNAGAVLFGSSW